MIVEDLRKQMQPCEDEEPLYFYVQRPDGSEEELEFKHVGSGAGGRLSFLVFKVKGVSKVSPAGLVATGGATRPNVVIAAYYSGYNWSIWCLFGSGPLWTIKCGHCAATFQKRVPMIDEPTVECPKCHVPNILSIVIER
jgi:hypothetical protein